jgi:hypothetical protein
MDQEKSRVKVLGQDLSHGQGLGLGQCHQKVPDHQEVSCHHMDQEKSRVTVLGLGLGQCHQKVPDGQSLCQGLGQSLGLGQ